MLRFRERQKTPPGPARPPDDRRCTGQRADGQRCSLWASPGTDRCRAHRASQPDHPIGEQSNRGTVAAVARIRMNGAAWRTWKLESREWQKDAWRLFDITGQLRFVANSIASQMSRARLYVAELDDSGEGSTEVRDPQIASLASGPLGSGDTRAENIRTIGLNNYVAGEVFAVALASRGPGDPDIPDDQWFVVSSEQVSEQGGKIRVKRPALRGGGDIVLDDAADFLIRVWTPHPADTDEPDSPTRSAIPDLRELEAIRKREFAELDSRLTGAGVFLVPSSMEFPTGDDDTKGGVEGFLDQLAEVMSTSLTDRSSAEAMVPIALKGPADALEKIRHLTFWSELSEQLLPLRQAALRSLAQSLDAPIETLEGASETNHWNLWLVQEETIVTHIEPPLARLAEALTKEWLRPALAGMGLDPDRYVYKFSTSALRVRGDRTPDAMQLHDRLVISDQTLLEAADYDEEDQPNQTERLQRIAAQILRENPAVALSDPQIRQLVGLDPAQTIRVESEQGEPGGDEQDDTEEPQQPRALPSNDQPEENEAEGPAASVDAGLLACCELTVLRALELAGGRLVPNRPRDVARHELHLLPDRPPTAEKVDRALNGAWAHLGPVVRNRLAVGDVDQLQDLLHQYTAELLTRGVAHQPQLLERLLSVALRGRGAP